MNSVYITNHEGSDIYVDTTNGRFFAEWEGDTVTDETFSGLRAQLSKCATVRKNQQRGAEAPVPLILLQQSHGRWTMEEVQVLGIVVGRLYSPVLRLIIRGKKVQRDVEASTFFIHPDDSRLPEIRRQLDALSALEAQLSALQDAMMAQAKWLKTVPVPLTVAKADAIEKEAAFLAALRDIKPVQETKKGGDAGDNH